MRRKVVKKYATTNLFFETLAFIERFQQGVDEYNERARNQSTTNEVKSTAVVHSSPTTSEKK